ncbi:LysM peptidoglycan-binding domain-containing protein [Yaniella halotolerans]|uniref:LysM peptidoglycan-binding domain-containing protein n=1 Tax=Yaniella halotolerans TaxID=225453 RepID=UPI0003B70A63|nr:LysM peptidoglycan-binding domain-containing protein [Yaniella halotolerans]
MATTLNIRKTIQHLKLTSRGRCVLQLTVGLVAVVLAAVTIAAFGSRPPISSAVAADDKEQVTYQQIVVQPGDTLWGISSRLSDNGNQSVVLDKILTYNHLETSELEVGQVLLVPASE